MIRNGRVVDGAFRQSHRLYYRFKNEDVVGDRLLAARIPYFDASVNWSKYSKPWDVIFDHPDFGIALFVVRDLPKDLPKEKERGAKTHAFVAVHVPEDFNYSHSEICTFKDGSRVKRKDSVGETAKKEFRTIMSNRGLILHQPKV
jgi:hypothetical protein